MKENFVKLTTIKGETVFVNISNVAYVKRSNGCYTIYFCVPDKDCNELLGLSVKENVLDCLVNQEL